MIYAAVILVLIGIAVNDLSKKYALHNLGYKREISKSIVEIGEEFDIATVVENKKLLPVTFLQVIEKFPLMMQYKFDADVFMSTDYIFHKTTMMILPYQRVKRTFRAFCNKRGKYTLSDVTLTVGDLLGLETFSKEVEYGQEIVVLPEILDLKEDLKPYGDYYGDISVKRWIIDDPVLTVGIREYTGSDPQRFIHWPSSLRTGKLMVKKFDFTSENTVMVVLNIECNKPFWISIENEKIEKCISFARAVVEQFEEQGIPYAFVDNIQGSELTGKRNHVASGYGPHYYNEVLENLGKACYGIDEEFEVTLERLLKRNTDYTTFVIITPAVLESYTEYINSISETSNKTVLISLDNMNLEKLNDEILTFIERREQF